MRRKPPSQPIHCIEERADYGGGKREHFPISQVTHDVRSIRSGQAPSEREVSTTSVEHWVKRRGSIRAMPRPLQPFVRRLALHG